jgi:hypothetical protein
VRLGYGGKVAKKLQNVTAVTDALCRFWHNKALG